jgi:peroxiredoxin
MSERSKSDADPRKSWQPAVAVLVLSAVFGYAVLPRFSGRAVTASHLTGKPAPDFSLPVFHGGEDGSRIRLSAMSGNVVVLDFWASWCVPCIAQASILSKMVAARPREDVAFVGINTADEPGRAREFARSHELPYPSVLDTDGIADLYGASSLPTLVVIDRRGHVASVSAGVISAGEIEKLIAGAGSN